MNFNINTIGRRTVSPMAKLCSSFLAVAIVVSLAPSLIGQDTGEENYQTLPLDPAFDIPNILDVSPDNVAEKRKVQNVISQKREAIRVLHKKVSDALKGTQSISQQEFNSYFENFYFANMTQTTPRKLGEYGDLRYDFFRLYMAKANGGLRQQLLQLTFDKMSQVAAGNFHPAARVNALLMIGKLDSQRGSRTNQGTAPVPFQPALGFLLTTVESADTPDHLKIAAMVGILHHAELRPLGSQNALDSGTRNRISQLTLTLMEPPPEDITTAKKDGNYWLRRQAAQTVGNMRDAGANSANAVKLAEIITNSEEKIWLRVDALEAFTKLVNVDANQVNPVEVSKSVAKFVATSAREDALFIEESIRSIIEVAKFLDDEDPILGSKTEKPKEREIGVGNLFDDDIKKKKSGEGEIAEILPVFRRQMVRQRIKTIVYYAQIALKKDAAASKGLLADVKNVSGADSKEAKFVEDLSKELENLMNSTNIVDIRRRRREEETEVETRSRAEKLKEALDTSAAKIEALLAGIEPAPEAPATEDATSEEGSGEDASGDASSDPAPDDPNGG